MSRMPQGILGQLSGKIGNVVGSSWKGISVLKIYQPNVSNPNTAGQQAQRTKFSAAVAVALLNLTTLIQPYWAKVFNYMSGFNAFIKININAFSSLGVFIPANFMSSKGTLTGFDTPSVAASAGGATITISGVDNSGVGNASASDKIIGCYYNETQNYWENGDTGRVRSTIGAPWPVNGLVLGDTLRVYPFFLNQQATKQSDSVYLTCVVGA